MLQKFPPHLGKKHLGYKQSPWKTFLPHARCGSPELRTWLLGRSSLTHKLVALSAGDFRVEVLKQTHACASLNEVRALRINPRAICLVREVILWGANSPWVFARSVLPLSSLCGRLRHLRKQGNKPLGAYLFQQPDLTRSQIETACLKASHQYLPGHLSGKKVAWGRRSIFYLDQKPLLVSEVFLEEFPIVKSATQI